MKKFFKKIIEFCDDHPGFIEAILILTLVGATIWYAKSTSNMANVMEQEFKASNRPIVFIDDFELIREGDEIDLRLVVRNSGNIPATVDLTLNIIDESGKEELINSVDNTILSPGEVRHPLLEFIKRDKKDLDFNIRIIYYSFAREKEKERYCLQYNYKFDEGVGTRLLDTTKCK